MISHIQLFKVNENIIGRGAYGKVYQTCDPNIVCKVYDDPVTSEGLEISVIRELAAIKRLSSPQIVKSVNISANYDLFMPKYNMDLEQYMKTHKFTDDEIQKLMYSIMLGVYEMHSIDILHRDLKPSNILLTDDHTPVICDFGLARYGNDKEIPITEDMQTIWYRAPEVLLGSNTYTTAVDMWSMGVIMCQLACGRFKTFESTKDSNQILNYVHMFGKPNEETWPGVTKLRRYEDIPEWKPVGLAAYLVVSPDAFNLISCLLSMDPSERINIADALQHPYFGNLRNPIVPVVHQSAHAICPEFMSIQLDLNAKMRVTIISWVMQVCMEHQLEHRIYFLACSFIDRFLQIRSVSRLKFQLVSLAAISLADKIMSVNSLSIADLRDQSDNAYSCEEIIAMEGIMFSGLDFNVYCSTEYTYLVQTHTDDDDEFKTQLKKLYLATHDRETRSIPWNDLLANDLNPIELSQLYNNVYMDMCKQIDLED